MSVDSTRRRYPRWPIQLPFRYGVAPEAPHGAVGWTRSLSEGGATVEAGERLSPQGLLCIVLHTNRGRIAVEGNVAWSKGRAAPGEGFLHGLTFARMDAPQLSALRDLVSPLALPRQDWVRLPLDVPVTCDPDDPALPRLEGRTGNGSWSGLLLRLPRLLPPGTRAEVAIGTGGECLTVPGAIVWVEPPEMWNPGTAIGHGFRFDDMSWPTLASLGSLLIGST